MSSSLLHRWAWLPIGLACWLCGRSTPARAAADPASPGSFDRAVQAVGEGSYAQAVEILDALVVRYPDRAGAWFWLARAQRGAGELAAAKVAVDRAIELDPGSPDARYLAGLLAWEQGDRARASAHFASVIELDPMSELGQAAAQHVSKIRWLDERDHAVALADAGQRAQARVSFRALDQQRPGDPLVLSHLGSLDLLAGDAALALGELDQALERAPDDPWTRYWKALALEALGRQPESRVELEAVLASPDADAADAASTVLKSAATAQAQASAAPGRTAPPTHWRVATAAVVDSNAAFVSEATQAIAPSSGVGWSASGSAQIPLASWGNSRVFFSPGASMRAYFSGPEDIDYAVMSARMELSHRADRLRVWAGLGSSGAWLGWSPYVDAEEIYSGLSWSLGPHALVRTNASVQRRAAHLVGYDNLDAFGALLAPQLRLSLGGSGWLGVGWTLGTERGNAYELTWSGTSSDKKPLPYDASLTAESTWTGQGPSLVLRVEPFSDRLELSSSVEFLWRRYGPEEQVSYVYPDQTLSGSQARRDRRLFALAGIGGHVNGDLWLFLRYSGLRNWSTLTTDVWPIDRSYTRHLVLSGIELRG